MPNTPPIPSPPEPTIDSPTTSPPLQPPHAAAATPTLRTVARGLNLPPGATVSSAAAIVTRSGRASPVTAPRRQDHKRNHSFAERHRQSHALHTFRSPFLSAAHRTAPSRTCGHRHAADARSKTHPRTGAVRGVPRNATLRRHSFLVRLLNHRERPRQFPMASSMTLTSTVLATSPGSNRSVPAAGRQSASAVAVPWDVTKSTVTVLPLVPRNQTSKDRMPASSAPSSPAETRGRSRARPRMPPGTHQARHRGW